MQRNAEHEQFRDAHSIMSVNNIPGHPVPLVDKVPDSKPDHRLASVVRAVAAGKPLTVGGVELKNVSTVDDASSTAPDGSQVRISTGAQ